MYVCMYQFNLIKSMYVCMYVCTIHDQEEDEEAKGFEASELSRGGAIEGGARAGTHGSALVLRVIQ